MTTTFGPGSVALIALNGVLNRLEAVEARIRAAEAERIVLLAEAFDVAAVESEGTRTIAAVPTGARAELAYRAVRAEVATVLHQSEHVAERQIDLAVTLTRRYRAVLAAHSDGLISERHAAVIADAGSLIGSGADPDTVLRRAAYESRVLEVAIAETPSRLRPVARRLAEEYAEQPLQLRHEQAKCRRRVYVVDLEDGMADLVAHLPAAEAHGIYQRLTVLSRGLEQAQAEPQSTSDRATPGRATLGRATPGRATPGRATQDHPSRRTRDELRADALSDLLLSGAPSSDLARTIQTPLGGLHARIQVMIPAGALISALPASPNALGSATPFIPSDEIGAPTAPAPPVLIGHGPIDPGTARRLAGEASHWDVIGEHRESGEVLSVDRYRPSPQMRRLLGARDQHCRFPGCRVPIARCDIDHTVDAARGGPTATTNLAHLCRGHHTLKHHTGWRVRQRGGGELEWQSPTGRTHIDRPPGSRVMFT